MRVLDLAQPELSHVYPTYSRKGSHSHANLVSLVSARRNGGSSSTTFEVVAALIGRPPSGMRLDASCCS